jgi:hypothetical protein
MAPRPSRTAPVAVPMPNLKVPWSGRLPVGTWAHLRAFAEVWDVSQADVVALLVERQALQTPPPARVVGRHLARILSGDTALDGPAHIAARRKTVKADHMPGDAQDDG